MNTVNTIKPGETTTMPPRPDDAEYKAARYYEEKFVPTLYQQWSKPLIEAAAIGRGNRVLDIACGTGVVTRDVAGIVGRDNPPTGLDLSSGMLAVARDLAPHIEWQQGDATDLPYPDASFDRVLCQFGLMFFPDRVAALKEMSRVLRPGGRLALAVWDSLDKNPGFARKVDILEHSAGRAAADALRAPFCLGDTNLLRDLANQAGLGQSELSTHAGQARFPNIHHFVEAELRGWLPVLDVHLDEATIAAIHRECEASFSSWCESGGENFVMPISAHFLCAG